MSDRGRNIVVVFALLLLFDVLTMMYATLFGPYPEELRLLARGLDPTSYRILYVHVPLAWDMYVAFTITLIGAILYLVRGDPKYDAIALTSTTLGVLYGVAATVTGMLWAAEAWGEPWSWDPRQTATLIMLLAYIGYIALRASISDLERARAISSAYGIAAYVTLPVSYLSAVVIRSLHEQLPQQPLGPEAYQFLGVRVIASFAVFLMLTYMYYVVARGKMASLEVEQ